MATWLGDRGTFVRLVNFGWWDVKTLPAAESPPGGGYIDLRKYHFVQSSPKVKMRIESQCPEVQNHVCRNKTRRTSIDYSSRY